MMASRFSQSICIVALSLFILADATPSSSSSPPSAIVRGMMDSDNQLLYMTVSGSTPRGGGERGGEVERSVTVESSSSSNPQTEQMHRAVVDTKEMSFADIVRKRAFLPRDNGSLF